MSSTDAVMTIPSRHGHNRYAFLLALGLGVLLFYSVGWLAMQPWDPQGPVSVLASERPVRMIAGVGALAVVVSALATAIAGRGCPGCGALVVASALGIASLRGGTMAELLIATPNARTLGAWLAGESVFWTGIMLVAYTTSLVTADWLGFERPEHQASDTDNGDDLHRGDSGNKRRAGGHVGESINGFKQLALASVIAIAVIAIIGTGGHDRAVRHGEAWFTAGLAFYLGVGRAGHLFPTRTALWSLCAVGTVAVLAYLWAWIAGTTGQPVIRPDSVFMRVLPVTYVCIGTAAALLAHWRRISRADGDE